MDTEIVRQIWQSTWQAQCISLPNNDWLTPQRIALLRELFLLIGVHWQGEGKSTEPPLLEIREDTRRQRIVMSLQTTHPLKSEPKEIHTPLQESRSRYLLALAQALEGSCVEMITQGILQGYTVILPCTTQGNPTAQADAGTQTANTVQPDAHAPPSAPDLSMDESAEAKEQKKARKREQLRQFFIDSLPQDTTSLEQARHQGDWESARRIAHQLKGCATSFGFPEITEQAMVLDELIKSEQISGYEAACDTLLVSLRKII